MRKISIAFVCSLIYGFTGVTNFSELARIFTGGTQEILTATTSLPACELGMVFLLVGFLFVGPISLLKRHCYQKEHCSQNC